MRIPHFALSVLLLFFISYGCIEQKKIEKYGLFPATIQIKSDSAFVSGTLGKIFYQEFQKVVSANPNLTTVVLIDIPGSVNDYWNIKSCELLYNTGLNTTLLSNSVVESGGADLFVSGKKLYIDKGAKIGVHSWAGAFTPAIDLPKKSKAHKMFLDFYENIDIDSSFYWYTIQVASPSEMHYMTESEIQKYLGHKLATE